MTGKSLSSSSSSSSPSTWCACTVPGWRGCGVVRVVVMVVAVVVVLMAGRSSAETTDFSNPIVCYTCRGAAVNSSCADPVDPRTNSHLEEKKCNNGVCLKWAKYEGGVLQMIRTCSAELNFHLTMIDGVCRTERNGNGYLCMCGKHLCNTAARPLAGSGWGLAILLAAYSVIVQRRL